MSTHLVPGTTYPSVVGTVIEKLRKNAGVNQSEIASHLGVTQATWSRIEAGNSALTIEQLMQVAEKLGNKPGDILHIADQSVRQLESQGIKVEGKRLKDPLDSGLALVGAAVLGAAIAMLISKK